MSSRWNIALLEKVTWRAKERISAVSAITVKPLLRVKFIQLNDSVSQEVSRDVQKEALDYGMPEQPLILGTDLLRIQA